MDQLVSLPLPTTPEQFLAWEALQEERHEFDGWAPVAMNGGTAAHARIERTLLRVLTDLLDGRGCEVFGATMKVRVGDSFRYPDASVTCMPVHGDAVVVDAPVALFEIISPGSATIDRGIKLDEYRSIAGLRHYVILEQDEPVLTIHSRTDDGWRAETLGRGDVLAMPEIGVIVAVDALYADVFPPG